MRDRALEHRRQQAALSREGALVQWCRRYRVEMERSEHGHHWQFHTAHLSTKRRAEWWPGTCRLVFDAKYKRPLVAASWDEVVKEIATRWGIGERGASE